MGIHRTHDNLYLNEDRKNNPKEYFKFILKKLNQSLDSEKNLKVLDVGCATGEFIYFLSQHFPKFYFCGMDKMGKLLERAKINNPEADFYEGDIYQNIFLDQEGNNIVGQFRNKFDLVFMLGTHSIFEDIRPVLRNLKNLIHEKGTIYLFGIFNPYNIDVLIRSRKAGESGDWETGWNMFSIETVCGLLDDLGLRYEYEHFMIDIDIPENKSDPLRSFTFQTIEHKREVVNGLQILHKFYLFKIDFAKG